MANIDKIICPLMGGKCIEDGAVVMVEGKPEMHACRFWVYVHGKDPQTGADIKNGDCAHAWTPVLLIENSKMQRETGAAVESFRNEMVKANQSNLAMLALAAGSQPNQLKLIEGDKS